MTSTGGNALFGPLFGTSAVDALLDDHSWVRALLAAEAALTRACAAAGLVDPEAVDAVGAVCADASWVDVPALGAGAASGGNPVIPLVRALRARVSERVDERVAAAVHVGATSQDILDTALMLLVRDARAVIVRDLRGAADTAAGLAATHRGTPMTARTLLQQALPTTFGALAATWGAGLDRATAELAALPLCVQLGGPVGTLDSWHPHGPAVRAAFAAALDLVDPGGAWPAERTRIGALAGALGVAGGAVAKAATDVVLLAQTEVGEVHEATGGESSSMPHKANPAAAITARAAAAQTPGLVATLLTAMTGELQRAAGSWHAEWPALAALLRYTGGAASRLGDCLSGLVVDVDAMRRNLGPVTVDVSPATELVDAYLGGRQS